jgi:hypothetical protein
MIHHVAPDPRTFNKPSCRTRIQQLGFLRELATDGKEQAVPWWLHKGLTACKLHEATQATACPVGR